MHFHAGGSYARVAGVCDDEWLVAFVEDYRLGGVDRFNALRVYDLQNGNSEQDRLEGRYSYVRQSPDNPHVFYAVSRNNENTIYVLELSSAGKLSLRASLAVPRKCVNLYGGPRSRIVADRFSLGRFFLHNDADGGFERSLAMPFQHDGYADAWTEKEAFFRLPGWSAENRAVVAVYLAR